MDSLFNLQADVNNTSNNTVWQSKANSCKFRNRTMSLDVAAVAADSVSLYAIKTPTRWIAWLQAIVNNTGNAKPTQVSPNRHNNVWINLTDYSGDKDRNLRPCCSRWLGNQNTSLLDSFQSLYKLYLSVKDTDNDTPIYVSPNRHNIVWTKRLFRQQERYYDRDFALVALYCNCLLSIHRLGG